MFFGHSQRNATFLNSKYSIAKIYYRNKLLKKITYIEIDSFFEIITLVLKIFYFFIDQIFDILPGHNFCLAVL